MRLTTDVVQGWLSYTLSQSVRVDRPGEPERPFAYDQTHVLSLVAGVDHIRHTHDPQRNAFSRGQPKHGAELADDLERLCQLHDPSTIAALKIGRAHV